MFFIEVLAYFREVNVNRQSTDLEVHTAVATFKNMSRLHLICNSYQYGKVYTQTESFC